MAKNEFDELELDDLEIDDEDLEVLNLDDNDEAGEEPVEPEPQEEKPKRGRPRKSEAEEAPEQAGAPKEEPQPKRRATRPRTAVAAPVATVTVDPANYAFLFRAALDNRIKDMKKAGQDTAQLEWAKSLADLLFG